MSAPDNTTASRAETSRVSKLGSFGIWTFGICTFGMGTFGASTSGTGTSGMGTFGASTSGTGTSGMGTFGASTSGTGTSGSVLGPVVILPISFRRLLLPRIFAASPSFSSLDVLLHVAGGREDRPKSNCDAREKPRECYPTVPPHSGIDGASTIVADRHRENELDADGPVASEVLPRIHRGLGLHVRLMRSASSF